MCIRDRDIPISLADKPNSDGCRAIAVELENLWIKGEIDKVEMIYYHFKSAGTQILTRKNYLPIDLKEELSTDKTRDLSSIIATKESQDYLKAHNKESYNRIEFTATPLNDNFIVEPDLKTVLSSFCLLYTSPSPRD